MVTDPHLTDEKRTAGFLFVAFLAAVLVLLYIADPSKYYFLNDDFIHIPLAAKNVFNNNFLLRPVSDLSLWMDNRIWGKNAYGYHLTNLLIHLANTFLVWKLAGQFFVRYADRETARLKAALAAILFLLYAFHSESLFWIIGRGGSLSTLFFLLATGCYLRRYDGFFYVAGSLIFFGIGLFVYESIFIFPAIAFFISVADARTGKTSPKRKWIYPGLVLLFFVLFLLLRKIITGGLTGDYGVQELVAFNIPRLFYHYNTLLARNILPPMANSRWFLGLYLVAITLTTFGVLALTRRKRAGVLFWLLLACFFVALLPPVALGIDTHDSESERFIYLPSVFFVLFFIEFISLLVWRTRLLPGIVLLSCTIHIVLLFQSAQTYRFAGMVSKQSLEFINTVSAPPVLHAVNLPLQYKGALIFRSGFPEAVQWICSDCKFGRIDTLGSFEYSRVPAYFSIVEKITNKPAGPLSDTMTGISPRITQLSRGEDIVYLWTDSSLIRIKSH